MSSLMISTAMKGKAPYRQVLTHGFTVDGQGRKMSKSIGNTVSPQDVMNKLGADILRLWVASTDYTGEMAVSDEILKRAADSYRRIRNTARFLLANLNGFDPVKDMVKPEEMVVLDRWAVGCAKAAQEEISEENPCLGWRGIRITLDQPEIFLIQVRAMLRANAATGNLSILLPMVTSIDEIDEAKRLIERAGREVEEMIGYAIPKPRIGVMLEVPSMVFMLPQLATRIDFISVGTNDLTQYMLAVDRNNTRVASIYDSLHPAMLRALAMIAREAEQHGLDLRLCGEMAGDSMCVAILVGLGFRHLSMNGRSVARVKYLLRHIDYEEAQLLAQRSLEAQLATEVRHQVAAFMERRGMGGLIRGGR
jgi:signal transduction protein with GAF and PtsI domain